MPSSIRVDNDYQPKCITTMNNNFLTTDLKRQSIENQDDLTVWAGMIVRKKSTSPDSQRFVPLHPVSQVPINFARKRDPFAVWRDDFMGKGNRGYKIDKKPDYMEKVARLLSQK